MVLMSVITTLLCLASTSAAAAAAAAAINDSSSSSSGSSSSSSSSSSDRPWLTLAGTDPVQAADSLVSAMTFTEKIDMLHGWPDSNYTGYVRGNTRLGIPPLNLNDGPQGMRAPGGSTAWPSAMTVGATWDRELARAWGESMGAEFKYKGANVQLGPGLCLARVPHNGRNFEYLSGGDPFLGYSMVQPVINGIQSQNVIANAKHW